MKSHTYSDIDSTFTITDGGNVKVVYDLDAINQSIRNIFATIAGERVRNPIGSALIRHLFEPMSSLTTKKIRQEITNSITFFEPRVQVLNLQVIPHHDMNFYQIEVEYVITGLNRRDIFSTRLRRLSE